MIEQSSNHNGCWVRDPQSGQLQFISQLPPDGSYKKPPLRTGQLKPLQPSEKPVKFGDLLFAASQGVSVGAGGQMSRDDAKQVLDRIQNVMRAGQKVTFTLATDPSISGYTLEPTDIVIADIYNTKSRLTQYNSSGVWSNDELAGSSWNAVVPVDDTHVEGFAGQGVCPALAKSGASTYVGQCHRGMLGDISESLDANGQTLVYRSVTKELDGYREVVDTSGSFSGSQVMVRKGHPAWGLMVTKVR